MQLDLNQRSQSLLTASTRRRQGPRPNLRLQGLPGFLAMVLACILTPHALAGTFSAEQRLACQIALEEVRWQARTWPQDNSGTKPARRDVLPDWVIQARIERHQQMETALLKLYGVQINADSVQAEIQRMIRASQAPAALSDMIAALDNDPRQVAECLARPLLVERRLRNAHARDRRWHGDLLDTIQSEIGHDRPLRETDSHFILEHELDRDDQGEAVVEQAWAKQTFEQWWDETAAQWPVIDQALRGQFKLEPLLPDTRSSSDPGAWLIRDHPEARYRHTAIWTGSEMIVWGGQVQGYLDSGARYDPATDSWTGMSRRGAPIPRAGHVAVWSGDRMIVWTGTNGNRLNSGGRYDPVTDTWTSTSLIDAPSPRESTTAVWTGTEMIVWGGTSNGALDSGGRYDPVANTWAPTSMVDAPQARSAHTAVWNGSEMLVWGGSVGGAVTLASGSRYNPLSDSWEAISELDAPSPRTQHGAVWTGEEMLIWGGWGGGSLNTGARYDPLSDSWTAITQLGAPTARSSPAMVWTGQAMVVWGGWGGGITGGRYEPASDSWLPTSTSSAPIQASDQSWIWTGEEMIIWGGFGYLDSGGRYNPLLDQWVATGTSGAPGRREYFASVWNGHELLVWGGASGLLRYNDGGAWEAATDSWRPLPTIPELAGRSYPTAVWTGSEMVVWGGMAGTSPSNRVGDGARLNLATEQWQLLPELGAPEPRYLHSAVWSGEEMIIWGGRGADFLNTGARYRPSTDSWSPVNHDFAADPRENHTAIWTGDEMIVWGGWRNAVLDTGGRYDPLSDSWSPVALSGAPTARRLHTAIWTGDEMIIWGGGSSLFTGGRYNPTSNSWTATTTSGAPLGRGQHTAVWSGTEMIVWGGYRSSALNSGGRYDPTSNTWTATTAQGAPAARFRHTAAWTGEEMLVWGGCCTLNSLGRYLPASPPEPPLVVISGVSPSPSLIDDNIQVSVEVSDPLDGSWPSDGQVVIQSSSGESCSDAGPPGFGDGKALFGCSIEFNTPGQRELVAFFSGSADYDDGDSSLQQVIHQVLTEFTYSVGGDIVGLEGSGLVLANNEDETLAVDANGAFQFPTPLPDGSPYAVTVSSQPTDPAQFCQVIDGQGTIIGTNVTDIQVQCSSSFHSIGGQVSGLEGSGLALRINGQETIAIEVNGAFTFPTLLPDGTSYAVSIVSQPSQPAQTCGVNAASGVVDGSDIDDIQVICITNSYTVGGSVSGLLGQGLVLQNNGTDDLVITDDGPFTFASSLPDGSLFAVSVLTQPDEPEQHCSVSLGGGVINGSNVTGVQVHCQLAGFIVTPLVSAGGSIAPDEPQLVALSETISFELLAADDHVLVGVQGSCGGELDGNLFTTAPIVADCTVDARFARISVTTLHIDPPQARPGQSVTMTATVSVAGSMPEGNQVVITASSGESCQAQQPQSVDQALVFECPITFVNPGERSLVASYQGSASDSPSSSSARMFQVGYLVDISVTLTSLESVANPGTSIDWLVELRNLGPDAATLVVPDWQLSPPAELFSWVCLPLPGSECPAEHGNDSLPAEIHLPSNGGLDLVISTLLPDRLPAQIVALIEAGVETGPPHYLLDIHPENNQAEAVISIDVIFQDRLQF